MRKRREKNEELESRREKKNSKILISREKHQREKRSERRAVTMKFPVREGVRSLVFPIGLTQRNRDGNWQVITRNQISLQFAFYALYILHSTCLVLTYQTESRLSVPCPRMLFEATTRKFLLSLFILYIIRVDFLVYK